MKVDWWTYLLTSHVIIRIIIVRRNLKARTAYLVKNGSNLKCQKVKLQAFGHIRVPGRLRVGECSILQSSCCKSSPGRSETSDATDFLAVGFSLFSWRREITRRRRIFCPTSKPMSAKPCPGLKPNRHTSYIYIYLFFPPRFSPALV